MVLVGGGEKILPALIISRIAPFSAQSKPAEDKRESAPRARPTPCLSANRALSAPLLLHHFIFGRFRGEQARTHAHGRPTSWSVSWSSYSCVVSNSAHSKQRRPFSADRTRTIAQFSSRVCVILFALANAVARKPRTNEPAPASHTFLLRLGQKLELFGAASLA